ncbi:MCM2/3/5 family protein [Pleurostoma richardsiae]|uniref:MCM2/3/5 family protein n=1 Tax=Pleurostoma richardsiae TaxID=41990 RepID=A0AA38R7U7_9PEZI|nr:MCM2/3/5 family protein [Pleurostoma richardsiae]
MAWNKGGAAAAETPLKDLDDGNIADTANADNAGSGLHQTRHLRSMSTVQGIDEEDAVDFAKKDAKATDGCSSRADVRKGRRSWLSVWILLLSVYSTVLSGVWLVVAIVQPRWGRKISSAGTLLPSTASLLTALLAKSIELSFVTVFVAFIGQVLTRRAFVRQSKGTTLSEMMMRNWVVQPGSLITHGETLHYAAVTFLGATTLIATVVATFYTTASDAMVSPKLKFSDWQHRLLQGYVVSSYANPFFVRDSCATPLSMDPENPNFDSFAGYSCLDVQYSGNSYHNFLAFLSTWHDISTNGTSEVIDIAQRPPGTATLFDNTTLTAAWIETENSNATRSFELHQRIINNITLAMPHAGVYAAATNPINKMLQPSELSGVGEYAIKASVVSPAVNVMCVNVSPEEMAPLVYTEWPNAKTNTTSVPGQKIGYAQWQTETPVVSNVEWLNSTTVDDIFRWGEAYGRRPPVFQLYPIDSNIITNTTVIGSDAIYVFDSYHRSFLNVTVKTSIDWKNMVDQWRLAIDLNGGVGNDNASNARILTELALTKPKLASLLPSMAEALAVLISSTLVSGALQTPFRERWDYPMHELGLPGVLQSFNASIMTQEYTSSHTSSWHGVFYVVLALVFIINLSCLAYFIIRSGLVTDFTEPANLFALAVNSPPSEQLKGSCGGGAEKADLVVPYRISYLPSNNHFFFEEAHDRPWRGRYSNSEVEYEPGNKPSSYERLSDDKSWL